MTTLVIVESPGKVKTIQQYLDKLFPNKFEVDASRGHVCDLPLKSLGFDPDTFKSYYEVGEDKIQTVNRLKAAARRCTDVVLAMDADREGEAIAHHLRRELNLKNPDRIVFTEITQTALEASLKNPRKIDENLVNSQETRRLLDRMIGWMVSPVARAYIVPESSIGRVQTVGLLLLVDLERRIASFRSVKHYGVEAYMLPENAEAWNAVWDTGAWLGKSEPYMIDRSHADAIAGIKTLKVVSIEDGESESNPSAAFTTSTLQMAAQNSLQLTPKQTMELAQKLYEAGAITYMRTDSVNFSAEAFVALKEYAINNDLPIEDKQRLFASKGGAQEAHEAIRPTSFNRKEVGDGKIQALYNMIWMRAVASQLKAARYKTREAVLNQTVLVTEDGRQVNKTAVFKAKGRQLIYSGWKDLTTLNYSEVEDDDKEVESSNQIPMLTVDQIVDVTRCEVKEKNTTPPKRLTSVGLIKRIESAGIGRPSTYVPIVETLERREYIRYEKKQIHVTDRGMKIINEMENGFNFIDVKYTANMEELLDEIALGKDWYPITKNFYNEINQEVDDFVKVLISKLPQHKCELCAGLVIKKNGKHGDYWSCIACKASYSDGTNKPGVRNINETTHFKCLECSGTLNHRRGSNKGNNFEFFSCRDVACGASYQLLPNSAPETPDFEKYREMTKNKCSVCSRSLIQRETKKDAEGRSKKFWSCTGYRKENPLCTAIFDDLNNLPDYEAFDLNFKFKCPECDDHLERRKKRDKDGYFWVCKSTKTKQPCKTFVDDKNKEPDFVKYGLSHQHKCDNCDSWLRMIDSEKGKFWPCSNDKCGYFYLDEGNAPNRELAKSTYLHKCPNCKLGMLKIIDIKKENVKKWVCSSKPCGTFLPDISGLPDLTYKPEKKTAKSKK